MATFDGWVGIYHHQRNYLSTPRPTRVYVCVSLERYDVPVPQLMQSTSRLRTYLALRGSDVATSFLFSFYPSLSLLSLLANCACVIILIS